MDTTIREIVDYWTQRESECGLSVDWAEAHLLCWRCAGKRRLQRCHIIPRALGGSDAPSNLVLLCGQCHAEAPNVADSEFMWTWLRAHATPFYGTYWQVRGLREFELIYKRKPFERLIVSDDFDSRLKATAARFTGTTSTHWGQGKMNPATVAWLIRQVEKELNEA
ncbi:HNH endonuclease [Undibacterium sp. CY21W]|nr:HNH endonuclease [Undibacterium sp. CY21W]